MTPLCPLVLVDVELCQIAPSFLLALHQLKDVCRTFLGHGFDQQHAVSIGALNYLRHRLEKIPKVLEAKQTVWDTFVENRVIISCQVDQ